MHVLILPSWLMHILLQDCVLPTFEADGQAQLSAYYVTCTRVIMQYSAVDKCVIPML